MRKGTAAVITILLLLAPVFSEGERTREDGSSPYFPAQEFNLTAVEDEPFEHTIAAVDPDGDNITFDYISLPSWLSYDNGTISGIPGNDDVGYDNFTVNISTLDGNASVNISVQVNNTPPRLIEISVAPMAWERTLYISKFDPLEDGQKWNLTLDMEGPVEGGWASVGRNGTVSGIPGNLHVGNWTFNLTLDDMSGGIAWTVWNITVVNEPPLLIPPSISTAKEYEPLELDFDSPDEGDGLTAYSLTFGPENASIDPESGIVFWHPENVWGTVTFSIRIEDGRGESETLDHNVDILDAPVKLLSEFPEVLVAGEPFFIDIEVDEEDPPWTVYSFNRSIPFFVTMHNGLTFNSTGRFAGRPWNRDTGKYEVEVRFRNEKFGMGIKWSYNWTFYVVSNSSFRDPTLDFRIVHIDHEWVVMNITSSPGSLLPDQTQVLIIEENDKRNRVSQNIEGAANGEFEFDISGLNGTLLIYCTLLTNNTEFFFGESGMSIEVEKPQAPEAGNGGNGGFPWLLLFFAVIVFLLMMGAALLLVEKTSYAIQTVVHKNGEPQDEVVLSEIQDRPTIRLKELADSISISRKDLITTLVKLEAEGHIRSVPDGLHVRFLPTVGSFVDGPLVMNRYQIRIAKALLERRKMSESELMEETGLSYSKLARETSLLILKGALSQRMSSGSIEYYLSARQKQRIRDWMGKG
ncbi:MAG: putative Ig domain-containing protein [Thermoplasmatota archaeon]